ncbi:protein deltex-like [Haliotis asinina]|uniref:protein deltex-like n=1 Tax=Haliotis asinina TaxID=109174 RepID=UPI003531B866
MASPRKSMTSSKLKYVESIHHSPGLRVTFLHGDIAEVRAAAIVTGENQDFLVQSAVTKALIAKSKDFQHLRNKLRHDRSSHDLWTVCPQFLGSPFRYVLFAFIERMNSDDWMKGMKYLYRDLFRNVEILDIDTLAVPLLGAGVVKMEESAIIAAARSTVNYTPSKRRELVFVASSFDKADKMVTQWRYEVHKKVSQGTLTRIVSAVQDLFEPAPPDRLFARPRTYGTRVQEDQSKRQGHSKGSTMNKSRRISLKEQENIDRAIAESLAVDSKPRQPRGGYKPGRNDRYSHGQKPRRASTGEDRFQNLQDDSYIWETFTAEDTKAVALQPSTDGGPVPGCIEDDGTSEDMLMCAICLGAITDLKQLDKCYHVFCKSCIDRSFREHKPVCPTCNMVYGTIKGNQPDGTMKVFFNSAHLPGYEDWGSIQINYDIPSGIQTTEHPDPGMPYKGITRRAYLPACPEGKDILRLLKVAFDRKLTFTIGRSTTTGRENVVTWNDIHHKTSMDGGPIRFGYPDPTYLARVRDELASKGVTADNL